MARFEHSGGSRLSYRGTTSARRSKFASAERRVAHVPGFSLPQQQGRDGVFRVPKSPGGGNRQSQPRSDTTAGPHLLPPSSQPWPAPARLQLCPPIGRTMSDYRHIPLAISTAPALCLSAGPPPDRGHRVGAPRCPVPPRSLAPQTVADDEPRSLPNPAESRSPFGLSLFPSRFPLS